MRLAACGLQADLRIAAKARGANTRCGDHGLPAANARPVAAQLRAAIQQQGNIRGRAANIGDKGGFLACQQGSPGQAGRRAGQDSLNRTGAGEIRPQQRAISLDHHQRTAQLAGFHLCQRCLYQPVQQADQPCIQQGSQRPPRPAQRICQLMAGGHRPAGFGPHQFSSALFMGRVAGGKMAGNGKGRKFRPPFFQPAPQTGLIQRGLLAAIGVMPTCQKQNRARLDNPVQPGARQNALIKADQNQPGPLASPFDNRIGGQRGGQADHFHRLFFAVMAVQYPAHRLTQPAGQILPAGQRLGLGQQLAAFPIQQGCISIGSACIKPQNNTHLCPLFRPGPATAHAPSSWPSAGHHCER